MQVDPHAARCADFGERAREMHPVTECLSLIIDEP
jgi:hypothetical protein